MPRERRVYIKRALYEVVSRAKEGLPLPPTRTTNEILYGLYGRAQRDDKVVLTNFVEMNNHNHILAIPKTPILFANFYKELKKGVTESVKALMDICHLNLWESRSTVAVVPTLEDVVGRLVYLFCNPAKAGLVDSIDDFPGLSSWQAFKTCKPSVHAKVSIPVRYYPKSEIPRLPSGNTLSEEEDARFVSYLRRSEGVFEHTFVITPLAWLENFGITDPKRIESIRQRVITLVYEQEALYRGERADPVIGAPRLQRQPYCKPHKPAKRGRKIYVITSDSSLRKQIISFVRYLSGRCRKCYEQVKQGVVVQWPVGVFIPWLPPGQFCSLSP